MFQWEALWIDFDGSGECAAKISVGAVSNNGGRERPLSKHHDKE